MKDNGERKKDGRKGSKPGRTWKTNKVKKKEALIVQAILGNPTARTSEAIAKIIGEPASTVARIMKNPAVKVRLKEILYDFVDKELVHNAVANISKSIITKKSVSDSRWLLEHMDFFPEKSTEDEDRWNIFQERLADGIVEIIKNSKSPDGESIEIDGLDPEGFIYYQPQRPVVKN